MPLSGPQGPTGYEVPQFRNTAVVLPRANAPDTYKAALGELQETHRQVYEETRRRDLERASTLTLQGANFVVDENKKRQDEIFQEYEKAAGEIYSQYNNLPPSNKILEIETMKRKAYEQQNDLLTDEKKYVEAMGIVTDHTNPKWEEIDISATG